MIKKYNIESSTPIEDTCGIVYELFNSENLSVSISRIRGESVPHYHKEMEEIYYILKGEGIIYIDDEKINIKIGDLIPIPKDKYHHIESEDIEILVITNPRFDINDLYK